jgi:hypothetical protein
MRARVALCNVALLLAGMPCVGAELFYLDHDPFTAEYVGAVGPLVISGEIMPGDYERLLSKIAADEGRFLALNKIILASDGGDVAEAVKIAGLVKSLFTQVIVGPLTGRCVSACFFIYAAAAQREADGDRLVGINRPFIADADEAAPVPAPAPAPAPVPALVPVPVPVPVPGRDAALAESRALVQVRVFLRENAVPNYLVDEMFRRASDDAYWLSEDDEKNLGVRSPAFIRYLREKCAWDENIERDTYAGSRPLEDLKQKLKCRARVTQADAHAALIQATGALQRTRSPGAH